MNTQNHLRNLQYKTILERAKNPQNQGKTNPIHQQQLGNNPICGDRIELTIKFNQTNQIIEDIKFQGKGCALTIASADLMAETLSGKTVEEALEIIEKFRQMLKGEISLSDNLPKLNIFQGVSQFPIRIKCVLLSWHALKAALK
ncbi:Fe-S cluster assembly sulfur transfer protein SufU [Dapis sp. BLCC M229]|uniref:Fe-S cluster assembly sulfur transfer protein SufU n=1 Tax=Dapis sp. BLCC M229 TaxID=3400188 RepID=UPI003CF3F28E